MTGRGIDQILPHPGSPELRESYLKSAVAYLELAERIHGEIPRAVDPAYPWGEAPAILHSEKPDAVIANLETSVTAASGFWPGKGVHYRMHPRNIACLRAMPVDVYSLANNHTMDFDRQGLVETLETLRAAGIGTAGAGRNWEEAAAPARVRRAAPDADRSQLLVLAVGHDSSGIPPAWAATTFRPGLFIARDLSRETADDITAQIASRRSRRDLVVVSIHWGSNWGYGVPTAHIDFAHRLIDGGVDLLHGHSSHHPRPVEVYRDRLILYGCGDLLNDYEGISGHEEWRGDLGAMYFATLSDDGRLESLRLVPTRMVRMRICRARQEDARWLVGQLNRASARFGARFRVGDGLELMR